MFPLCDQCGAELVHYINEQSQDCLVCHKDKIISYHVTSSRSSVHPYLVKGCPVCLSREILFSDVSYCSNINCPAYHIELIKSEMAGDYYKLSYTGSTPTFYDIDGKVWQIEQEYVSNFLGEESGFLVDFLNKLLNKHIELGKIRCRK